MPVLGPDGSATFRATAVPTPDPVSSIIFLGVDSGTTPAPSFAPPISSLPTLSLAPPTIAVAPTAGEAITLDQGGKLSPSIQVSAIRVLAADPASPIVGEIWYRSDTSQLSVRHDSTTTKRVTLA